MKRLVSLCAIALVMVGCGGNDGNESTARWLDLEIKRPEFKVEIVEPEPPVVEEVDGDELITGAIVVPPSFLTSAPGGGDSAAPDPFAAPESEGPENVMTAKEVLEHYGVVFGPGSWAKYRLSDNKLIVRQTRDQMDLVEAVTQSLGGPHESRAINLRVEIFEVRSADALALERSAGEHFENTPELTAVIDLVKNGNAEIVTVMGMKCRSGQRAQSEAGVEFRYLAEFDWIGEGKDRILKPVFKTRMVGTLFEADAIIGPYGQVVDVQVTLEHHTAPPKLESRTMAVPGEDQKANRLPSNFRFSFSTRSMPTRPR